MDFQSNEETPSTLDHLLDDVGQQVVVKEEVVVENSPPVKLVSEDDEKTLVAVLQFLKKNNFVTTVSALQKETKNAGVSHIVQNQTEGSLSNAEVSSLLSAYSNEADPSSYYDNYKVLQGFVHTSLDANKWELAQVLYPVFVHMYLELVYNSHKEKAHKFYENFHAELDDFHGDDLLQLGAVTTKSQMEGNTLVHNLRSVKYVVRMSNDSHSVLKQHLQDKNIPIIQNILQRYLTFDTFDGLPRTKTQIKASAGGLTGEAKHEENKTKVYFGLLKEPDIDIPLDDEDNDLAELDNDTTGGSKSKKRKKKEFFSKKNKADPNAPSLSRIPLPELKDADKLERIIAAKESLRRIRLGGVDQVSPSVCCYTFTNAYGSVTAVDICDDSSLIAAGFQDSHIRVWSLTQRSLRSVKTVNKLSQLDKETDDIFERMMDDTTGVESRCLFGHSGTVFSVSFSPCRTMLVSSSEDGTVRLWSLLTWTNLMAHKGHTWSVWDVQFGPYGHYFVSCGQDRLTRLWVTDHHQAVRIFAGHLSDVDCLRFHHNSNYIATGSSDRNVRVWDVLTGNCVRVFTGHKKPVMCLCWSPDGRYLTSGDVDGIILIWDIQQKVMVGRLDNHTGCVHALVFSRDGEVLASGGVDCTVKIWDFHQLVVDVDYDDIGLHRGHATISDKNYLISDFPTKSSPIQHLHFTRRNLLLAIASFENS